MQLAYAALAPELHCPYVTAGNILLGHVDGQLAAGSKSVRNLHFCTLTGNQATHAAEVRSGWRHVDCLGVLQSKSHGGPPLLRVAGAPFPYLSRKSYRVDLRLIAIPPNLGALTATEQCIKLLPNLDPGFHPHGRSLYFGKIVFQSSFMLTMVQPFAEASSRALSSLPTGEVRS